MNELNLRLGGLAGFVTGLLLVVGTLMHFRQPMLPGHAVYFAGFVVMPLAIIALYASQARQIGPVGLVGFTLAVVGNALNLIPSYLILAELTGSQEAHQVFMVSLAELPVTPVSLYLLDLGLLLLGIASIYTGVFPPAAGLLLGLGAALDLPAELMASLGFLWPAALVMLGAGWAWIGWTLWRGAGAAVEAQPAI